MNVGVEYGVLITRLYGAEYGVSLLYCALSQLTCAEETSEADFNKYASMLVDVYEAGMREIG